MSPDQKTVAFGAVFGVGSMVILAALLYHVLPVPDALMVLDRLVYTLRLHVFTVLPLFIVIMAVGNRRFLTEAIDPLRNAEDRTTDINRRVAGNTLEQTLVFIVATLALSTYLEGERLAFIPAAIVVFILSRFAFWIGYRMNPLYRAAGMSATAYLNVGIILAVIYFLITT
jgi:hypothetical protein